MCLDERLASGIFKNQITTLTIEINPNKNKLSTMENICNHIFSVFLNLTHLIFYESSYQNIVRLLFEFPSPKLFSSTLSVLNIKVQSFDVCLYLLDGRFHHLHTFYIESVHIHPPDEEIENQVSFTKKKRICF